MKKAPYVDQVKYTKCCTINVIDTPAQVQKKNATPKYKKKKPKTLVARDLAVYTLSTEDWNYPILRNLGDLSPSYDSTHSHIDFRQTQGHLRTASQNNGRQ